MSFEDKYILQQLKDHKCDFFAAITDCITRVRRYIECWKKYNRECKWYRNTVNPFKCVLISPTQSSKPLLNYIRSLKESGQIETVMFDSGGYSVKTGVLTFNELCSKLHKAYKENNWADIYVLPDNPPLSQDSKFEINRKVKQTIDSAFSFATNLTPNLHSKLMPVIHGRTEEHIKYCIERYDPIIRQTRYAALGSFATSDKKSTVNRINTESLKLIKKITSHLKGVSVHNFGIGSPPAVLCLAIAGINSFDSTNWKTSAHFGSIYFPFLSDRRISNRVVKIPRITIKAFDEIKTIIGHRCPFCENYDKLQSWDGLICRVMHNLDVSANLNHYNRNPNWQVLRMYGSKYYRIIKESFSPIVIT